MGFKGKSLKISEEKRAETSFSTFQKKPMEHRAHEYNIGI